MNQMWHTHLQSKVEQLKEQGQYRNLHVTEKAEETWLIRNKKKMLNLASNNYLGLAGDERLNEAAIACTRKYGTGATASRLVVGNYPLYEEVEKSICSWRRSRPGRSPDRAPAASSIRPPISCSRPWSMNCRPARRTAGSRDRPGCGRTGSRSS